MRIEVGKYVLYSDKWCFWINERFETIDRKTKQPTGKFDERKVAGYSTTLTRLLESFRDTKVGGSDAESLEELLIVLRSVYGDMVAINTVAVEKGFERIGQLK